jgi:hypothetical protein
LTSPPPSSLSQGLVIGSLGALVTECFRRGTDLLHFLFTGSEVTIITNFERLPLWQRLLIPVIGDPDWVDVVGW